MSKESPNRLRELRESEGMSRAALAAAIGVGEETIARYERGVGEMPDRRKYAIADALKTTPAELMGWTVSA